MISIKGLKSRWEDMAPGRKRAVLMSGLLVVIVVAATVFKKEKVVLRKAESKTDMSVVIPTRKDEGLGDMRTRLDTLTGELSKEREENHRLSTRVDEVMQGRRDTENRQLQDFQREIGQLKDELKLSQSAAVSGSAGTRDIPQLPAPIDPPRAQAAASRPEIRVLGDDEKDASDVSLNDGGKVALVTSGANGQKANVEARAGAGAPVAPRKDLQFLPMGTIFRGLLLNGVDAPTSGLALKQPVPALARLKQVALLPNRATADVRECEVMLAGHGNLSSERVKFRAEAISCVRPDGGIVEAKIDGYVVDVDGKEGLRGRLVTKQGAVIARGLAAGALAGFGQMMTPTLGSSLSINPTQQPFQAPDMGMAASAGASRGIAQAATDFSKFFYETAKEMYPVIELPGGVEVTIILVRGASLAFGNSGASTTKWGGSWFGQ